MATETIIKRICDRCKGKVHTDAPNIIDSCVLEDERMPAGHGMLDLCGRCIKSLRTWASHYRRAAAKEGASQ